MKKFNSTIIFLIILVIVWAVYINSLHNPFMIDDHFLILRDEKIHNLKNLFLQFIPDKSRILNIEEGGNELYYRPLAHILPMLAYALFHENVVGYHVMNLLLFVITGWCIFLLTREITQKNSETALICSLLYAVHPLNGLFINYITASVFAMQVSMMCLAAYLFLRHSRDQISKTSIGCFLLSLLCHETSLSLPIFIFILSLYWFKDDMRTALRKAFPYILIAVIFVLFRLKFASLNESLFQKFHAYHMDFWQYLATYTKLIFWYLSNFFYPLGIVMIWTTPILTSNLLLWILIFGIGLSIALGLILIKNIPPVYRIGGLWFLTGLLPILIGCLFQPKSGLMIEPHWLFFASCGIFMIFADIINRLPRPLIPIVIFCLLIYFSYNSIKMNKIWSSEIEYCKFWYKHSPHYKNALYYLAFEYESTNQLEQAKIIYNKMIENSVLDWQIYNNLALIAVKQQQLSLAETYYQKALQIKPKSAIIHNNLGSLYQALQQSQLAITHFKHATHLNPFLLEPRANLAKMLLQEGQVEKANQLLIENLKINSQSTTTWTLLLQIELKNSNFDKANGIINQYLMETTDPQILQEAADTCLKYQQYRPAAKLYKRLLQVQPQNILGYINLGKIYGNHDQFQQAITIWQKALEYDPHNSEIPQLIREAQNLIHNTDK